jgi:hypothetical protein
MAGCVDFDFTPEDIFNIDIPTTTLEGTVYVGPDPLQGFEAILHMFEDSAATTVFWQRDGRPIDRETGAYEVWGASSYVCPALAGGLYVQVRFRKAPAVSEDPWHESAVQPWTFFPYSQCEGATLVAANIVIPLPE